MGELLANLREVIAGVLEVMQEEGRTLEENVQVVELAVRGPSLGLSLARTAR